MEDGDSDEGGAGHLLTAWLGELDTLKKVRNQKSMPHMYLTFLARALMYQMGRTRLCDAAVNSRGSLSTVAA